MKSPIPANFASLYLILIFIIAALAYYPGLHGPFMFDDFFNIVNNEALQLKSLTLSSLRDAALSSNAGPLRRPVSMLTFALNYSLFGKSVFAFKAVNLLIHCINSVLVYSILLVIAARHREQLDRATLFLAFVFAAIWAIHPLNLSSVLYVVQRMASLATLFMLVSILCYCVLRLRPVVLWQAALLAAGACLGALLAVFSKENSVVLVPVLACMEMFLFSGSPGSRFGIACRNVIYALCGIGAILALVYFFMTWASLVAGYETKHFSMYERLLTQSRVLWTYLGLFFVPNTTAMGLFHDDLNISTSLLEPASTIISIVAWFVLIIISFCLRKRFPYLILAVSIYLVSHSIESTVFSLELMHEHRNYFPSFGILLACFSGFVASGVVCNIRYSMVMILMLVILFSATFNRSWTWSDWGALVHAQAVKMPDSPRSNYIAGRWHYLRFYEEAVKSPNSPHYKNAKLLLERAYQSKPFNLTGLTGLYMLNDLAELPIEEGWSIEFEKRLGNQRFSADEINKFIKLLECQYRKLCQFEFDELEPLVYAATNNPTFTPARKAVVFNHAVNLALSYERLELALYYAVQAVNFWPGEPQFWENALRLSLMLDQKSMFDELMSMITSKNIEGLNWNLINELKLKRKSM